MIDDRRPLPTLPESIGAVAAIAIQTYRRRLPLFLSVTLAGFLIEALIAFVAPNNLPILVAGEIVVDAFIATVVTIGVVSTLRNGEPLRDGAIVLAALERWGLVAIVTTVVDFITLLTEDAVVGPPEATGYGFLILPIIVLWGSIGFATVIAATDQKKSLTMLVFTSLGRSMALAFARPNFGRLIILALVAVLPVLVEAILFDQLGVRKIANAQFLANVPIDVLVTGPLQALFTVFYLDFVRRSGAARAR